MSRMSWRACGAFVPVVGIVGLILLLPTGLAGAQPIEPVRPLRPAQLPGEVLTTSSAGAAKLGRSLLSQADAAERSGSDEITYVAIKSSGPIDISGLA